MPIIHTMKNQDQSYDRLMLAASRNGLRSAAELNRYMTIRGFSWSGSLIANWKARGVSKEGALDAEEAFGVSAIWILKGIGTESVIQNSVQEPKIPYGGIDPWNLCQIVERVSDVVLRSHGLSINDWIDDLEAAHRRLMMAMEKGPSRSESEDLLEDIKPKNKKSPGRRSGPEVV